MKKSVFLVALVALTSTSFARVTVGGGLAEKWTQIVGAYGGVYVSLSGQEAHVPVPAQLVYQHPFGYIAKAPLANEFIVRVGPQSHGRGCIPQDSSRAKDFTGIVSQERGIETTKLKEIEWSPSKRGWVNYVFSVNGGTPINIQAINVVFRPTRRRDDQCHFEVLYRNTERQVQPPLPPLPPVPGPGPIGPQPPVGPPGGQPRLRAFGAAEAVPQAAPAATTEKAKLPEAKQGLFRIGQPLQLEKK